MIADPSKMQAMYNPKRLRMLMSLMNQRPQAPQPNLTNNRQIGQSGNIAALARGMPANLPGRPIRGSSLFQGRY